MGIRQTLNEKPALAIALAAAIVLIAGAIIVWQFMGSSPATALTGPITGDQAYYSDDDGKTFFPDDVKKLTPFKHGGKEAVRAHVFRCSKGDQFVGYLERHTELAKQEKSFSMEMGNRPSFGGTAMFEIKKPGAGPWVPVDSKHEKDAVAVMGITCPGDPTDTAQPIIPGQQQ